MSINMSMPSDDVDSKSDMMLSLLGTSGLERDRQPQSTGTTAQAFRNVSASGTAAAPGNKMPSYSHHEEDTVDSKEFKIKATTKNEKNLSLREDEGDDQGDDKESSREEQDDDDDVEEEEEDDDVSDQVQEEESIFRSWYFARDEATGQLRRYLLPELPAQVLGVAAEAHSYATVVSDDDGDEEVDHERIGLMLQQRGQRRRRRRSSSESCNADDGKAYLLAFLSLHANSLKCTPRTFFDWLVNAHGIVSLGHLISKASDSPDDFLSTMQINGLKGYKKHLFIKEAKKVHDIIISSNWSTETTDSTITTTLPSSSRSRSKRLRRHHNV